MTREELIALVGNRFENFTYRKNDKGEGQVQVELEIKVKLGGVCKEEELDDLHAALFNQVKKINDE